MMAPGVGSEEPKDSGSTDVAALAEQAENIRVEELESAILRNRASFAQLAVVHFHRESAWAPDRLTQLVYDRYYPKILQAFEKAHGPISKAFWCLSTRSGVVLTESGELHMDRDAGIDAEVEDLLFRCDKVSISAQQHLRGRDPVAFRICMERLYYVTTDLLAVLDDLAAASKASPKGKGSAKGKEAPKADRRQRWLETLKLRKLEIERIEDLYVRSARRRALWDYFVGMIGGIVVLGVVLGIVAAVVYLANVPSATSSPPLAGAIAGGAGAVVSVMTRMQRERIVLDYEAGPRLLHLFGGFRPIIGAVMGSVFFALISSGLLPFSIPTDPGVRLYFFAGVAFLAGFSERWAQDMLVETRSRLGALPGEKETSPPSA